LILLGLFAISARFLPQLALSSFYTFSLLLKDLLVAIMPLTVAFFIAHTVASFQRKAPLFIATIIVFEMLSNFAAVWYSYSAAFLLTPFLEQVKQSAIAPANLEPLWRLHWAKPSWWSADKGSFVGLMLGCLSAWWGRGSALASFLDRGKGVMEFILSRIFARLIPLFILGFFANLYHTGLVNTMVEGSPRLLVSLLLVWSFYLALLFLASAGFSLSLWLRHVQNLLPAGGIALGSGCSLSTMPWTIAGAEKNLQDPSLAPAVIPATTNIQQIGDAIANSFLCFALYTQFFGELPSLALWLAFSFAFVLARFATAAVLGGAIFVMLPVYESYLHFSPEMIALILAYNVVLDPLITSSNVLANGALCRVFERVWESLVGNEQVNSPTKL
jgi:Na+/H+-dicarboxylate symporter